jgi:hypothetical protein
MEHLRKRKEGNEYICSWNHVKEDEMGGTYSMLGSI